MAIAVAAYALSPIDLIPDFVPILGYLDDIILVPAGIWLALKLVPPRLMTELRAAAAEIADRPVSRAAAVAIAAIWALMLLLAAWWALATFDGKH